MDLQTRTEGNAIVVTISGRLDAVTAPEYEKRIRELIDGGNSYFVVDFEQLDYISSAGLRGSAAHGQAAEGERRARCALRTSRETSGRYSTCAVSPAYSRWKILSLKLSPRSPE